MSFFLLILYIICTIMRPMDWVPILLNKPLIDILAISTFISLILEKASVRKLGISKVPQNLLMFLFMGSIMMSHIANTYFFGLIEAFQAFIVNFILFFLVLNSINSTAKLKIVIWVIVILTIILVPQGMFQLENGYGWAGQELTLQGGKRTALIERINWIGIFNDPNDLALLFVIAVGFILPFIFGRTNYFGVLINVPILATLCYGIFLTNSRGGLVALMTTIYFFFVRRTRKFLVGGIVGGCLGFLVLVFGPSRAGMMTVSESSAMGRVELWYQGVMMIKTHPLFGVGFNMYMDHLPQTAHNSFILAAGELGLFGLFCWVALIYCSFKGLSIVQEKEPKLYNYALGVQSSLIGFSAAAFFLSRTYIILPYLLFALSGALMYITNLRNPECNFRFTKKDVSSSLLLSLGVLFLAYTVVKIGL